LARFLEFFPPDRILVFIYEDWVNDPLAFVQNIYGAVGVDSNFAPPDLARRYNPTQQARYPKLQRIVGSLSPLIMRSRLPRAVYTRLSDARQALWRRNSIDVRPSELAPELRRELVQELEATIDFVEVYIKRPLPAWRS
jgi:hypothetical protein